MLSKTLSFVRICEEKMKERLSRLPGQKRKTPLQYSNLEHLHLAQKGKRRTRSPGPEGSPCFRGGLCTDTCHRNSWSIQPASPTCPSEAVFDFSVPLPVDTAYLSPLCGHTRTTERKSWLMKTRKSNEIQVWKESEIAFCLWTPARL